MSAAESVRKPSKQALLTPMVWFHICWWNTSIQPLSSAVQLQHSKNWSWINHLKITRRFFWSLLLLSFHKWNGNYVLIVVIFKFADAAHRATEYIFKKLKRKAFDDFKCNVERQREKAYWQVKRLFQTLIHRLPDSHKNTG